MPLTIPNGPVNIFDAAIQDLRLYELQAKAQDGNLPAIHRLYDGPQFTATAKTTDNAAASKVIGLSERGVTFPAGSFRKVRFTSSARTDNDVWIQEWEQWVWGNDGTTPKLVGTARLINAVGEINGTVVQYGKVAFHGTTSGATVTPGALQADVSAGLSLGNFSSGVATLTHPIARATARVEKAHISEDAGTIADHRLLQLRSASSTTMTVNAFTQNGTEALGDPTGVNNVDIGIFILPPPSIALVMNSNAVEVHCGHDATDDVYHDVEVFVGPTQTRPTVAD